MHNYKYPPYGIRSDSDEALFRHGIRVFDRHGKRIAKHLLRVSEADPVLPKITLRLGRIEFNVHIFIMHILYILSTKRKRY